MDAEVYFEAGLACKRTAALGAPVCTHAGVSDAMFAQGLERRERRAAVITAEWLLAVMCTQMLDAYTHVHMCT